MFFFSPQKFNTVYPHLSNIGSEAELNDAKETIQLLLRWGWKNNKNVEEQAAQLHMLTAWSQLVEVCSFLLYIVVYIVENFSVGF
jgi:nuclear pore complex protein Nup205